MDDESFVGFRSVVGYQKPEVEYHYVQDAESLHHFLQSDAVVSGLHISGDSFFNLNANQMESLGRAVGNSDHLRELQILGELGPDEIALEPFFTWIAHNRSIEIFRLYQVADQYNFTILAPFFEHNRNLRCIELNSNVSKCIPTIISALSRSNILRLARIDLIGGVIGDKNAAELINTLNAMPGLPSLLDLWLAENKISTRGCVALRALLKNPECNIISLDLSSNPFDDECIGILIDGFIERGTLKSLGLGYLENSLTVAGWKIFSNYLSGSKCKLEKILLDRADVADDSTSALGGALAMNGTLKCLDFSDNNITPTGWRGISNCLAPTSTISELNLGIDTNINDEVALIFFSALANNTALKKLLLVNDHITSAGWVSCFRQLIDSRSALVDIEFGWQIDDEGVAVLTTLVAGHMNTVSSINLEGNSRISSSGYSSQLYL